MAVINMIAEGRESVSLIENLKTAFNVRSDADLFKKVLALASVVSSKADDDGMVHMRGATAMRGVDLNLRG